MTLLLLHLTLQMIFHFLTYIKIEKKWQPDIWGLNKHSYTQSLESSSYVL